MNPGIKWGILGTGSIAKTFARDLKNHTNHQIHAVGSRTAEAASKFSDEFGGIPISSYEQLVQQDVDAIYIATPHPMHAPNTLLALNAGKPVLCEKPFAVNSSEARAMIDASRKNQLLLVEAMWSRFLPHYRMIKKLLEHEEFGEIVSVQADHGQPLPAATHHRLHAPELAGGALLDLGIYPLSFASLILGTPSELIAKARFTASGVDSQTSMILSYESGAQANLSTTLLVRTPCAATIVGTKATLYVHGSFYTPTSMTLKRVAGSDLEIPKNYEGHGIREQAIEFSNLLNSSKTESEIMPLNETYEILQTMDEVRRQIALRYPFEN